MATASLTKIYNRLNSIESYHPMSADTYADWAMEAGDVVKISKEGTTYSSPVGTSTIKWNGQQTITVNTDGNRERDSISKVSSKKYSSSAGGGSGIRSSRKLSEENQALYWEMTSEDGTLKSSIRASESALQTDYEKKITDSEGRVVEDYTSRFRQTAKEIEAEVKDRTNTDKILEGKLDIQSDKVSLVVGSTENRPVITVPTFGSLTSHVRDKLHIFYVSDEKKYYEWKNGTWVENAGPGNYINVGGIVSAINDDGTVTTQIHGDRIIIGELDDEDLDTWAADARNGRGVFAKYLTVKKLTAQEIETLLANIGDAQIGELNVGELTVEDNLGVDGEIMVRDNDGNYQYMSVSDVQPNGNTLTITYVDGSTKTFSKATTLSGTWSGSASNSLLLTITASPQTNVSKKIGVGSSDGHDFAITVAGGTESTTYADGSALPAHWRRKRVLIQSIESAGAPVTRYDGDLASILINETDEYNAGYNALSAPTVSISPLASEYATQNVSGTASIANTTGGSARSTSISLSLENSTYRNSPYASTDYNCVNVKNGNQIVARISTQSVYNSGFDAVSAPEVTWTALADNVTGVPSGTASIANKTSGTARNRSISLTMSAVHYTPTSGAHAGESRNCVVVKKGSDVIGRIDIQGKIDTARSDGFDDGEDSVGVSMSRDRYRVTATLTNGKSDHYDFEECSLYCVSSSPSGSGYYNVTFTMTTRDSYREDASYYFYK